MGLIAQLQGKRLRSYSDLFTTMHKNYKSIQKSSFLESYDVRNCTCLIKNSLIMEIATSCECFPIISTSFFLRLGSFFCLPALFILHYSPILSLHLRGQLIGSSYNRSQEMTNDSASRLAYVVSDALTLLVGFQIRQSFDMASLAYRYHIALTKVSHSLCLQHLYSPV